jgi:hypothetical protein
MKKGIAFWLVLLGVAFPGATLAEPVVAAHGACQDFSLIPDSLFDEIRSHHKIFYGHTSHGSQIVTGLDMLSSEDPLYARPVFYEIGDDLGHYGDTTWAPPTRSFLNAHPDYDVVMWSWCGGVSDNTEAGIDAYLSKMNELESAYPGVLFVYMTGHLDGGGPSGNLYVRNDQIREYCLANDKVLFDFADIESWDPAGVFYPWETDACGWCSAWCASHPCPTCGGCAHSHCFNCYRKGMAWWWMMARASGWQPTVGTAGPEADGPSSLAVLSPNRPNPFNPETAIDLDVPRAGSVLVTVHDAMGAEIARLLDAPLPAGRHSVRWDGKDASGAEAGSGVYFVRLRSEDGVLTRKIALLR